MLFIPLPVTIIVGPTGLEVFLEALPHLTITSLKLSMMSIMLHQHTFCKQWSFWSKAGCLRFRHRHLEKHRKT